MATLILSAVGTAIGGPIGGSIGALIGSQIDQAIFKSGGREGGRLKELQVTTSTYGTPIPRHYGKIRSAGSIIWSTDLVESTEKQSGGKGQPSVSSFSYSASFAVALASRPIKRLGRIWADGNLLRGAEGDLKVGGTLRIYCGYGDQQPDELLASALGPQCPAFRGLAYCVFENLQLAEYGNRFPALTFEVVADDGEVALETMITPATGLAEINRPLTALVGFSDNGGSLAANLEAIDEVYPLTCDAAHQQLSIKAADAFVSNAPLLPEAAADPTGDSFAGLSGESRRRQADARSIPEGMRYYDLSRDYQAGLQRADGRARPGRSKIIEFPGALDAQTARKLANKAAERASASSERIAWRLPELDTSLAPGMVVQVPRRPGLWRIEDWEWRENGLELQLLRLPHAPGRLQAADAGLANVPSDLLATPTLLMAVELPWDGQGSSAQRQVAATASSAGAGWTGASIYADRNSSLVALGSTGRSRSVIGWLASPLGKGNPSLLQRQESCEIELASADFQLVSASLEALAVGESTAAIGEEIVQFAAAERISATRWRIGTLLRGRGGSEVSAVLGHPSGTPFALLGKKPPLVDPVGLGDAVKLAAVGIADPSPVVATVLAPGRTLRPLCPVHPRAKSSIDGSLSLAWTRRARGGWFWRDEVDVPLNEESERYSVGIGDVANPAVDWNVSEPLLTISAATYAVLLADHAGKSIWVRQIGSHSTSEALLLHIIS